MNTESNTSHNKLLANNTVAYLPSNREVLMDSLFSLHSIPTLTTSIYTVSTGDCKISTGSPTITSLDLPDTTCNLSCWLSTVDPLLKRIL